MIWGGVSTVAYAALRQDDERLAAYASAVVGAAMVGGGVWYAWWQTSHGPLPGAPDIPAPAAGAHPDVNAQLDPGSGYRVARPAKAYGRPPTIAKILDGVSRYHTCAGAGAPDLVVGNISRFGGGPLPPHASHRTGRDVDIMLPTGAHNRWCLLKAFILDPQMEFVFYDQMLIGKAAMHAHSMGQEEGEIADRELGPGKRVRHWKGHRDHIHVRFRNE